MKKEISKEQIIALMNSSVGTIEAFNDDSLTGFSKGYVSEECGCFISCFHEYFLRDTNIFKISFPGSSKKYGAKLLHTNEKNGVMIFKFRNQTIRPLITGNNALLAPGAALLVPHYSYGDAVSSLLTGSLHALHCGKDNGKYIVDVPIDMDDYGCPLLDSNGNVVGIITEDIRHMQKHEHKSRKMRRYGKLGLGVAAPCRYFASIPLKS